MAKNIFFVIAILILLSSCYSSRKAKVTEAINQNIAQQEKELAAIKNIELNKDDKLTTGKIDSTIERKIYGRLNENRNSLDSVKRMMDSLTASINNRKAFRKSYKTIIKSKIVFLRNNSQSFDTRILNYGLIDDVLNNAKQSQFDLATFFGPGEFLVPADKMEQAKKSFMPLVDSILKFAKKYAAVPKSSTIVLKGYTDATGVKPASPLYYRLANEIKLDSPTKSDLNLALSKLRTQSISNVVNRILQEKQTELLQLQMINIELVQEGRGEEIPNKVITDYTDNDPRRRIVLFFWSLLPK